MFKKVSSLLIFAAVLVLGSCSSKMKEMKPEFFTVTPEVLEVTGNEVPVTIDGKFPAKFFNKKSVLTITPVLKYKDGEAIAESSIFQGENIRGNDKTISYDNGGNFRMKMTFDYVPAMEESELYLRFSVNKGNKSKTLPEVKIADGCIATSQLYQQHCMVRRCFPARHQAGKRGKHPILDTADKLAYVGAEEQRDKGLQEHSYRHCC